MLKRTLRSRQTRSALQKNILFFVLRGRRKRKALDPNPSVTLCLI